MDKLLNPDIGLMIWTWVAFGILLGVLWKLAWGPILAGIESRESKIKGNITDAEKAQAQAEALRQKYETQLNDAQRTIQDMVSQAKKDAERTRGELLAAAKEESERLLEKGRRDLAGETDRLKSELRGEVAGLSMEIAEKIVNRSIDHRVQDEILKDALKTVDGAKK